MSQGWLGLLEIFAGIGILLFAASLVFLSSTYYFELPASSKFLFFGIVLGVIAASYFGYIQMRNRFREKYGFVESKSGFTLKNSLFFLGPFLAYVLFTKIDAYFALPFSLTIVWQALLVGYFWYFWYRGLSNIILYLGIVLILASFIPWQQFYGLVDQTRFQISSQDFFEYIYLTIAGIAAIIAGITNRLILSKIMKPVAREEELYESV